MNARPIKALNRRLDGFEGQLTTRQWTAAGKCSSDTALRDIGQLIGLGVLHRMEEAGGGRNTGYERPPAPVEFRR